MRDVMYVKYSLPLQSPMHVSRLVMAKINRSVYKTRETTLTAASHCTPQFLRIHTFAYQSKQSTTRPVFRKRQSYSGVVGRQEEEEVRLP